MRAPTWMWQPSNHSKATKTHCNFIFIMWRVGFVHTLSNQMLVFQTLNDQVQARQCLKPKNLETRTKNDTRLAPMCQKMRSRSAIPQKNNPTMDPKPSFLMLRWHPKVCQITFLGSNNHHMRLKSLLFSKMTLETTSRNQRASTHRGL